MDEEFSRTGLEIAIIGMTVRIAGAKNISQFWNILKNSVESISFFSEEELIEVGNEPAMVKNPNYVKGLGILEERGYFDSAFFEYSPIEAQIIDPQMRIFHECAWKTLEDAGYCPDSYSGLIGIYAGASPNFQWEAMTVLSGRSNNIGNFAASLFEFKGGL